MSAWKVGQRVRLVSKSANATSQTRVGAEGSIIAIGPFEQGHMFPWGLTAAVDTDCVVGWDCGRRSTTRFFRIEPITKPGLETVDWSKSLCRPDGSYNPSGDHLPAMTPEFARAWGGA